MKKIEIRLLRISRRGPQPTVVLTSKILEIVKIKYPIVDNSHNLVHDVLNELYINRMYTQAKIAEIFGVQRQTVKRWLKRLNIPIRERYDFLSKRLLKYKRESFADNEHEMAYLLGLRFGDIYAQKHGRFIRVSVSTTHPAMLHLFKKSFGKYSEVNMYPKYDKKRKRFLWSIYCDLDYSFNFLIKKNKSIPVWIIKDNNLSFHSFLATLILMDV